MKYYLLDSEGHQMGSFTAPQEGSVLLDDAPDDDHRWTGSVWMSDLERLGAKARTERNRLLSESDWTQLPDATVDRTAWTTYRQELRQWPEAGTGFPNLATIPTAPGIS